jgi:hypothetical protein
VEDVFEELSFRRQLAIEEVKKLLNKKRCNESLQNLGINLSYDNNLDKKLVDWF